MKTFQNFSLGFNSRTREGATDIVPVYPLQYFVSIHAPVRVRPCLSEGSQVYSGFNSRTREGATYGIGLSDKYSHVSIHAPVRVRLMVLGCLINTVTFQFTHP